MNRLHRTGLLAARFLKKKKGIVQGRQQEKRDPWRHWIQSSLLLSIVEMCIVFSYGNRRFSWVFPFFFTLIFQPTRFSCWLNYQFIGDVLRYLLLRSSFLWHWPYSGRAFFDLLGPGGGGPNLHRIVYVLNLITTDTVMSLWRDMTSLCRHLFLNLSLKSSTAINLLNTVLKE